MHGIHSYVAVPLRRRDGSVFGTLCALDPEPRSAPPEVVDTLHLLADLVGFHLDAEERSEERERFLGVLGHDLRGPLHAIALASRAIAAAPRGEAVGELAAVVTRSADRMSRMIEELLDFARGRFGEGFRIEPADLDAVALARRLADEVRVGRPERSVALDVPDALPVRWDASRIGQVLDNLLRNALEHAPEGSTVRVRLAPAPGDRVVLEVENDGDPIPPDLVPRLFEPFARGGSGGGSGGLGLGLFICREIADAHGGSISVASDAERGTRFRVVLPRRAEGGAPPTG